RRIRPTEARAAEPASGQNFRDAIAAIALASLGSGFGAGLCEFTRLALCGIACVLGEITRLIAGGLRGFGHHPLDLLADAARDVASRGGGQAFALGGALGFLRDVASRGFGILELLRSHLAHRLF